MQQSSQQKLNLLEDRRCIEKMKLQSGERKDQVIIYIYLVDLLLQQLISCRMSFTILITLEYFSKSPLFSLYYSESVIH